MVSPIRSKSLTSLISWKRQGNSLWIKICAAFATWEWRGSLFAYLPGNKLDLLAALELASTDLRSLGIKENGAHSLGVGHCRHNVSRIQTRTVMAKPSPNVHAECMHQLITIITGRGSSQYSLKLLMVLVWYSWSP